MSDKPRVVSADEAMGAVEPGSLIAVTGLSAEPLTLLEALGRRAGEGCPMTLLSGMMLDGYRALSPKLGNEITLDTWFMPQTLLGKVDLGPDVNFLPLTWSQTITHISRTPIDVGLVQVSPADAEGYHSLGVSVSLNRTIVDTARLVIAQVNQEMPYTLGPDSRVHRSQIDFLVEGNCPLHPFPHRRPDERDAAIAEHVAQLIRESTTIQVGIGTVPSEVLRILSERDLTGIRLTSQITDAARALIDAGRCVTEGPAAVVGDVIGSRELYKWVDRNEQVHLVSGTRTHSLQANASARNLVSINSTLEVDLYGQINSEILDQGQAGGIGGSLDFMMAAQLPGNLSIVALPSTTGTGASRIVPRIGRGIVTVPRSLTQVIVTEFGAVDLRGMTERERAQALIGIAHPDHRDQLSQAAELDR